MKEEYKASPLSPKPSSVVFEGDLNACASAAKGLRTILITDPYLAELYSSEIKQFETILVPRGEKAKTLPVLEATAQRLLETGADRRTHLIAFGGGAICDFTGFLASIYMRGISFSLVPTTLLAQVDAAYGGKTGVNLGLSKNLLGQFTAPEVICIRTAYTLTQQKDEWVTGLSETVKHAAIADSSLFHWLEMNQASIMKQNTDVVQELVRRSASVKLSVVASDPFEISLRKILNFGHTIGHAIELVYDLSHGKAVSLGMAAEVSWSQSFAPISHNDITRLHDLLKSFTLPVNWEDYQANKWKSGLLADKKKRGSDIELPVLTCLGEARIMKVPMDSLQQFFC